MTIRRILRAARNASEVISKGSEKTLRGCLLSRKMASSRDKTNVRNRQYKSVLDVPRPEGVLAPLMPAITIATTSGVSTRSYSLSCVCERLKSSHSSWCV